MNLLLVDDDVPVLQDLQQKLNWHALGFERVFTAQSAFEATRLLGQLPVHIVVCDINAWPKRSGFSCGIAYGTPGTAMHRVDKLCPF